MSGVWVPVLASMKGFIAEVEKGAGQASKSAGKSLEKGLSDAGRTGGQSAADELAKAVGQASSKVAAARKKEAGAAADLQVAEEQLAQVRSKSDASASELMAAEAKVEDARRRQEALSARLGAAEKDLQAAREGGETRVQGIVSAENRLEDARLAAQTAAEKVTVAEQKAQDAREVASAAASKVEAAERRLAQVKSEAGEGSKEAERAERELESARKAADRAAVNVEKAEGNIRKERAQAATASEKAEVAELQLDAAHDKVAQSSKRASSESEGLSGALDGVEGAADLAAGAMGALGLAMGAQEIMDSAGAISQVNNQLGLTGDAATAMGDQVGDVLRSGIAGSTEEAAGAIGSLNSQFGWLGFEGEQTAQDLADNFLAFSQTFGTSIEEATQTAGQLIQNGLATDVEQAADLMTAAMQRVPAAMRDELPEIINEYGTNFRALGFSGEEAFGLLVAQADKGKWALDKTGDSLKEFTIRGSDMSKTSVDAYGAIGLSAEEMSSKIASGGEGAKDALKQVADGILGIEDPATRANTAIALFGTPLEDLSVDQIPEFMESLSQGVGGMEGFSGSSQAMADQISDSLEGRLNALKGTLTDVATNGFMAAWDAVKKFVDILGPFAPVLGAVAGGVGAMVTALGLIAGAMKLAAVATTIWNAALALNPMVWVAAAVIGVVTALALFFTKTEVGKRVWQGLMDALSAAWEWIKGVFGPVFSWLGDVISGVWDGVKRGWDILWQGIQTAWNSVLKPTFDVLWQVVSTTLGVIGTVILAPLMIAWNILSAAISAGWNNVIKPAWDALSSVAQWLWNSVLMPVFGWIKQGWELLAQGIQTVVDTIIKPAWDAVGNALRWLWDNVVSPVIDWIKSKWEDMARGFQIIWESVIKPAWDALGNALRALWDNVVSPVVDWIKGKWDEMGNAVNTVVETVAKPAFEALKNALQRVRDFFGDVVNGIKSVWDGLRSALAKPINFMINTVYNDGILKAWNTIAKFIPGLNEAGALSGIPEHATGGAIRGPGNGTSDDVLMWGSNGEHMMTAKEVQELGGQSHAYAMRAMIRAGKAFTFDGKGGLIALPNHTDNRAGDLAGAAPGLFLPAFKDGGEIRPAWEKQLENGHRAAKMRDGHPYTWGFEDCSGYMSMIADAIINGGDGVRRWATSSFPGGQPWVPGLGEGFSVGVHDDPGGPGGGHTAGTLTGVGQYSTVNVESGGAHGNVAYGGPAAGADSSQFVGVHPGQFHLAIGADGAFESAGGPSPAQKQSFLRDKVEEVFGSILDPIASSIEGVIGAPPPEWLGIPRKAMDASKDKTIDFIFNRIDDLGNLLGGAYDKAKDIGSAIGDVASTVWNGTVGRLFDTGGILEDGGVGVNRSGKPERVLSPSQTEAFDELVRLLPALLSGQDGGRGVELLRQLVGSDSPSGSVDSATASGSSVGSAGASDNTLSGMAGGTAGGLVSEAVSGQVADFLGVFGVPDTVPSWMVGAGEWSKEMQAGGRRFSDHLAGNDTAEDATVQAAAGVEPAVVSTASTEVQPAPSAYEPAPLYQDLDEIDPDRHKVPEWGEPFFTHEIARNAQDHGLPASGAKIGVATALVESGDPMKMWANNAVPESLNFRHDAVGSDYDSVGLFQQRDNGAWGTVADRMDPYRSAGMFFDAMLRKFPNWQSMDPGAVAQGVQVSAFPDRYNTKMSRAQELVDSTGLYDQGGVLDHKKLALNLSGKPEAILTNDQWTAIDQLGSSLSSTAGSAISDLVEGGVGALGGIASGALQAGGGALGAAANAFVPGSGAIISGAASAAAPLVETGVNAAGWYAGQVGQGWMDAWLTAGEQVFGTAFEPVKDVIGVLQDPESFGDSEIAEMVRSVAGDIQSLPGVDISDVTVDQSTSGGRGGQSAPVTIVVQNLDQAFEAKKHQEAREAWGFIR
ncbi:phage tail tape measure protein [Corynebacterium provencense]|uniref:phage tail tape measure protein n=1 Tax=Corynebacterium provencense TaxID=1737425 RepID=UPI00082C55CA|nr:phage tail tape measure protein [Corynebacterium provencense]